MITFSYQPGGQLNPIIKSVAVIVAIAAATPTEVGAEPMVPTMTARGQITGPFTFPEQGGPAIYQAICQGCHMPDATGATGAGTFPALAKNPKLGAVGYPIVMVLNGKGAMPRFKTMLDDQQIADVVTYIRTNFGNRFARPVTPTQVKELRNER